MTCNEMFYAGIGHITDAYKRVCIYNKEFREDLEKAREQNTKLRELCRRFSEYISYDRCEGCVYKMRCNNGYMDECWQLGEIRDLARELGMEVDE